MASATSICFPWSSRPPLLAVLVMSFLVTMLFNSKLSDDPIYRKRLEEGPG